MSSPPSFNEIREKYVVKSITNISQNQAPPTNILDQIPGYNSHENKILLNTLEVEYNEQCALNRMLQSEDIENQTREISEFVSQNNENVEKELQDLTEITTKLKSICNENRRLETEKTEFNELLSSHECNEIAEKMRKIKSMKQDVLHFLDSVGLRVQ